MSIIKYTLDIVRDIFLKDNYVLLSDTYINNKQHLSCLCPSGHKYVTRLDNWLQGHRCPTCDGQSKVPYAGIKTSFEKEGYILLSNSYVNSRTKLKYICKIGHNNSMTWSSWQRGCRCSQCAGNIKLSLDFIREIFNKEGYTLLVKEYKNSKTKLDYICNNGHIHSITWSDFNAGYRCATCHYISITGEGNHSWKGGVSFEPYCPLWKDKSYKTSILERDTYICQNPYCFKITKALTIHHIDYDKKNCHPSNLITVCRSCNAKANTDRKWHKDWYQAIMYKKQILNKGKGDL